jgi:hypothetical protein
MLQLLTLRYIEREIRSGGPGHGGRHNRMIALQVSLGSCESLKVGDFRNRVTLFMDYTADIVAMCYK